ncbi:hypothetical protein BBJ28_00012670 [Nothophytophthora sp. Chile5]|nr:hypothetical protein BBJ28_00012670 [Nothophytophthora sp. Chile5]
MSAAPGRFDALLTQLAQQHGGVESLLDSFFDFLHRKTDFYVVTSDPAARHMGFLPGQAQQKVLRAFQKYPMRDLDGSSSSSAAAVAPTAQPAAPATEAKPSPPSNSKKATPTARAPAQELPATPQLTKEGKQGAVLLLLLLSAFLRCANIQMELAPGTRAKDLNCRIEATRLRVALKSDVANPLLEGELPEKIRADDSIWSLEGNRTLSVSLEKAKPTWWASALRGHAEIDTSQVDSRRNIQDYDESTQGAIRKAVFDQRQQQLQGPPLTREEQMLQGARDLPGSPFLASKTDNRPAS